MPAFNPFVGKPLDWLNEKLALAQEAYGQGKMSISFGAADSSGGFQREVSTAQLIRQLSNAIYVETGDTRYLVSGSTVKTKFVSTQ